MEQVTEISKAAFIARVNQVARAVVVDSYYKKVSGVGSGCVLMLVYSDGTEKQFTGLRAA